MYSQSYQDTHEDTTRPMLDSDFWKDLGQEFRSIEDCTKVAANWTDVAGSADRENWATGTTLLSARLEFEALARRAGARIDPKSEDAFAAWLSRLKREGREDLVRPGITTGYHDMTRGQIQNVCTVSADYCRVLESRALSTEQEINRHNVPSQDQAEQEEERTEFDHGVARRAAVDRFLLRVKQETVLRALKTHIWKAAGHTTPRQFQYWQAGKDRLKGKSRGATTQDGLTFQRILDMDPKEFVALLYKKHVI
jgi:hypothetical protein